MSLKKRLAILSAVLSVALLFAAMAVSAALYQGYCGEGVRWSFDSESGVLTVAGSGDMQDYSKGHAPWNEYLASIREVRVENGVGRVGNNAFRDCTALLSVTLGDSVREIGTSAFQGCAALTSVSVSESLGRIATGAFWGCSSLGDLSLPDRGILIEGSAFFNAKLYDDASLWKNGLLYLGNHLVAAKNGQISSSVTLKEGTKSVAANAFSNCTSLQALVIPASVEVIGATALKGCTALCELMLPFIGETAAEQAEATFAYFFGADSVPASVATVKLWEGATAIAPHAFSGCKGIKTVILPDTLSEIGDFAFYNCIALDSIAVGEGLDRIGTSAFLSCGWYNRSANWENNALYLGHCLVKVKNTVTGTVKVKAGTRVIADGAFGSCTKITAVELPEGVTVLGNRAFYKCTSLGSVALPDGTLAVGNEAFLECSALKSVSFSASVIRFGVDAFSKCSALESVTFEGTQQEYDGIRFMNAGANPMTVANRFYAAYRLCTYLDHEGRIWRVERVKTDSALQFLSEYPEKPKTVSHSYPFKAWKGAVEGSRVTADITLTPTYSEVLNRYLCIFLDEDGETEIDRREIAYGSAVTLPEDPQKPATPAYTYRFLSWEGYTAGMKVSGDHTFVAKYEKTVNTYECKFLDEDGETVLFDFTLEYGAEIPLPEAPEKLPPDEDHVTAFLYWEGYEAGLTVGGDCAFRAVYQTVRREYVYRFLDSDGITVLYESSAPFGALILLPPVPEKTEEGYLYQFLGWEGYERGMTVSDDHEFVAVYRETCLIPPHEAGDVNRDGKITAKDVETVCRYVLGQTDLDEEQLRLANVWQPEGEEPCVNLRDAFLIRQYLEGEDVAFYQPSPLPDPEENEGNTEENEEEQA